MNLLRRFAAICTFLSAGAAWAGSPWLPDAGKMTVSTVYAYDSFQDYHPGKLSGTLPAPYNQYTGYTFLEYGLKNDIAIDLESGYTATDFRGSGLGGITDTTIGARWQFHRTDNTVWTVRAAGIVAGSYAISTTANFSPGDKASGGLGSISGGWNMPHNFYSFIEAGYRVRTNPVPQDAFGTAGIGHSFKRLTYSTSFQTSRSINGVDIVGAAPKFSAYFQPAQFPATKKVFDAMDFNTTYHFKSGLNFGFDYSKILDGRNVGMKNVLAFSFGFTMPGHMPHIE